MELHDKLLKLIDKLNDILKHETLSAYPLASGNCGMFAIALSQVMDAMDIDYSFKIFTTTEHPDTSIPLSWNDAIEHKIIGNHVCICIDGKNYDALGSVSDEALMTFFSPFLLKDCHVVVIPDKNIGDMKDYIQEQTTPWLSSDYLLELITDTHILDFTLPEKKEKLTEEDYKLLDALFS